MDNVNTHCCAYKTQKMKIKNTTYLLLFTTLVALHACCSKEGLADVDYASFIFINKSTGINLFSNANSTLNKDSIFISYNDTDNFQKLFTNNNQLDSVITIDFNKSNTVFVKFPDNDIDTFKVGYETISSKTQTGQCKLSATIIKNIQYNNELLNTNNLQNSIKINK